MAALENLAPSENLAPPCPSDNSAPFESKAPPSVSKKQDKERILNLTHLYKWQKSNKMNENRSMGY